MFINQYGTQYVVRRLDPQAPSVFVPLNFTSHFDVFLINKVESLTQAQIEAIAMAIAPLNIDWVETFGPDSEQIHDAIDHASVAIGRQEQVGDGDPMTGWTTEILTDAQIVSWINTDGLGYADFKLVIIVGTEGDEDWFIEAMKALWNQEQDD